MKQGFLGALRHARETGQLPDPSQPQASPLHEQLEASLAERQAPPELVQGTGALAAPRPTFRPAQQQAVRTSTQRGGSSTASTSGQSGGTVGAPTASASQARKQSFEQLFGDERGTSGAVLAEQPMQRCGRCEGSGIFQFGAKRVVCAACQGAGQVEVSRSAKDRFRDSLHAASRQDVIDAGLGSILEVETGADVIPPAETSATIEEPVATGSDRPAPVPLSYDLPIDFSAYPAFVHICGPAGTGKTMLAKALLASDPAGTILAATTGIAAVNLGEGTTINALLRFYDLASLRDAFTGGWLEGQLKKLRRSGLKRIILDEVSMLDGDQLTIICRAIDNVNQDRVEGEDEELGLVLVGDFAQLSPVPNTVEGKKAPITFAFESPEWERFAAATYKLETIRRQGDVAFIQGLLAIRRGDAEAALAVFGPHLQQTTLDQFPGTTILAKNEAVSKYNQLRLDKVTGAKVEFPSDRWGKLRGEWGAAPKPEAEWGVPKILRLKVGCQVMVLANQNDAEPGEPPTYRYVNGDQGVLEAVEGGRALVRLARTGEPVWVETLMRYNEIPLEVGRAKALRAQGTPELVRDRKEVLGWIRYMPLRLSYASTVHKSQGLSLDRVQVNLRDHFFSQPGMAYTALSRCRTLAGLRIVGSPEAFAARCTVNPKVEPYL